MSEAPDAGSPAGCSVCGGLPDSCLAQTGYGDALPAASRRLEPLGIDNMHDVWRCPACGLLFHWEDLPQYYGSGNLDQERLDRLSQAQGEVVRTLLEPGFCETPPDQLIARAARELPRELLHPILRHLRYQEASFETLVPPLAELLVAEDDQPIVSLLLGWAGEKGGNLRYLAGLLERGGRPLPRFGEVLRKLVRERLDALSA